jgi:hypothetical protein
VIIYIVVLMQYLIVSLDVGIVTVKKGIVIAKDINLQGCNREEEPNAGYDNYFKSL